MKKTLRILAIAILVTAGVTWGITGANKGWTRTSTAVKTVDAVTGIEGIEYRKQFVPGLDFLGVAIIGSAVLIGASFLSKKQPTN